MTIDTTTIKAGDKLHLRDGSVLVVNKNLDAAGYAVSEGWQTNGFFIDETHEYNMDIMRIEPKPEPVVRVIWPCVRNGEVEIWHIQPRSFEAENIYKLTFTDGEPSIERVK
jgi:hypothetical protein